MTSSAARMTRYAATRATATRCFQSTRPARRASPSGWAPPARLPYSSRHPPSARRPSHSARQGSAAIALVAMDRRAAGAGACPDRLGAGLTFGRRRPPFEQKMQDRAERVDVGALVHPGRRRRRPAPAPCSPWFRPPSPPGRPPHRSRSTAATPQSISSTSPNGPSMMFCGLRSRWRIRWRGRRPPSRRLDRTCAAAPPADGSAARDLVEPPALHSPHGVEGAAVGQSPDVVHRHDAGMLQRGEDFRLRSAAGPPPSADPRRAQRLERHVPAEQRDRARGRRCPYRPGRAGL